jgi:hypothetical protein
MRADAWSFRLINLLLGASFGLMLWAIFGAHLHDAFFLIPMIWIMHVRSNNSRWRELNSRMALQNDLLGLLVDYHSDDALVDYEYLLEKHGFEEEADQWAGDVDISRT